MKSTIYILLPIVIILSGSCVKQFIPETYEEKNLLVIEGMITDQPVTNKVKISRSLSLEGKIIAKPVKGYIVTITDDKGNSYRLTEKPIGTYNTDSTVFRGVIGRIYKLTIRTNNLNSPNYTYESLPMELKPVPPIDSLYYKKIATEADNGQINNGCQIYLDTHDPENKCKFYRWDYSETWEFHIPFLVPNYICWVSDKSNVINIKSTNVLSEDIVSGYPMKYISTETDRLSVKYSMLVNQYSLNEDEFDYWSKLQNVSEEVGGLYDITPASIPGNIFCLEDPAETVLGYFSVSSKSSKRMFVKDYFPGVINLYTECVDDTIFSRREIQNIDNTTHWIIEDGTYESPPFWVITDQIGCADCTARGTKIKPPWWE